MLRIPRLLALPRALPTASLARRAPLAGFAVLALLLVPPTQARGQVAPAAQGTASPGAPAGATALTQEPVTREFSGAVVFEGDTLVRLYGRLGPFTPEVRAAAIGERMRRLARVIAEGDSIRVVDREGASELSVGEEVLMTVLDADTVGTGLDRQALALKHAATLAAAMEASGKAKTVRALLIDAGFALIATLALILVLRLFRVVFPRLYARLDGLGLRELPSLKIQKLELISAARIAAMLQWAARALRVVATLLVLYFYVPLVLSFFPWTAPLSRRIVGIALRPFANAWNGFIDYLPNLFYLAAGVIIVRYLLKLIKLVADAISAGTITIEGFHPDWSEPTYKIVRTLVFIFAVMVLYPYLPGAGSDAFKGVSLFVGVLFSLGSSGAVGNMVAGVVLTYTRAFNVGDRVKVGETTGDVIEKTLLVTRLRTIKNVSITIPNGQVLGGQIVNYTALAKERGLILHTSVTIGYDAPWKTVHELLIQAAERTTHILKDPKPFVHQTSLDDFYVAYQLNAYTDRADAQAAIYSELHGHIQDCFNEGGVEILSPHYRAQRDGNMVTIPASYLPADYKAPSFRVEETGKPGT